MIKVASSSVFKVIFSRNKNLFDALKLLMNFISPHKEQLHLLARRKNPEASGENRYKLSS